ncbi:MAG: efflux RND transporter periplasmic adaptor subunit [Verrucomicrobiales bacterium]|nr:efflux RND transporter periplasmic adaptor subunit [Verrucomicrobiales bacterium]
MKNEIWNGDAWKPSLLVVAAAVTLTGCGKHEPETHEVLPQGPAVAVSVITVAKQPHEATEEIVGTVRSKQQAVVEAKVSGRVEQSLAVPGQTVKAGDLLVQLDVREIEAKVESAKAMLEQADRELARYRQLVSQNAATRQELEANEARQKVAAASVAEAETMLGYARVTAPFDGVVTRKLAEVGDLAMPGKPLVEIESPKGLRFETDLPEELLEKVSLGEKMAIRVPSAEGELEGTVSEIAPVADPVSRTFRVKLDLPAAKGLRTGQFGRVAVPVAESKLLAVPVKAVVKRGQLEEVFVVADGRAWMRLVKTGKELGDRIEILSGLEVGEQVVPEVPDRMLDGQPVEVKP